MKIEKHVLCDLDQCYAASYTVIDGKQNILFASEGQGACYAFSVPDFARSTVWDGPGGTMSIVPIPGKNGDFLAVQRFFPTFRAEAAVVVWGRFDADGGWTIKPVLALPYIHRFDILQRGGRLYFLGATLCTSKRETADWSSPGKLYAAELPDDLTVPMKLSVIKDGLTKNHGYCHVVRDGSDCGVIACEEGVFSVSTPAEKDGAWHISQLLSRPVSDVAMVDIDSCGELELVTIEPFHGTDFLIHKRIDGVWRELYRYPEPMDFVHVAWGGLLRGVPTVIGGYRRGAKALFLLQVQDGKIAPTVIDEGFGPSNIAVLNGAERDLIITANREAGQAAVYLVED